MVSVSIYTDGACSRNPGPGGWGAVLLYGEHRREISGYCPQTTNQRMELYAAVQALSTLKRSCQVTLYSDSAYLVNAFRQRWLSNWQQNGWKNARNEPVSNEDLWKLLLRLTSKHQVEWIKVKGHRDNKENNRCDQLARQAITAKTSR